MKLKSTHSLPRFPRVAVSTHLLLACNVASLQCHQWVCGWAASGENCDTRLLSRRHAGPGIPGGIPHRWAVCTRFTGSTAMGLRQGTPGDSTGCIFGLSRFGGDAARPWNLHRHMYLELLLRSRPFHRLHHPCPPAPKNASKMR